MEPIALVGMECIFPGAPDVRRFWENIVNGVDAIVDVPEHRWPKALFDPDSRAVDRFYCRRGGFIDEYADFDPLEFGIMPRAIASAEPDQLLALKVGAAALRDAGYLERELPRERTAVILGRGGYAGDGTLRLQQHVRVVHQTIQTLQDVLPHLPPADLERVRNAFKAELTHFGPDVAAGVIPNLVASRLANRLDLRGPAYTIDAACASSLLAVEQSCQALLRHEIDVALTGGLHLCHDLTFWATFCQLGALSRKQQIRPFSADADGILAAEGLGFVVLKRLSDAEAEGDRIYAVLHGVGSASDGRSSSLLAPSVEGQMLALRRAWHGTHLKPEQLGLLEGHGTATLAGDEAELETVRRFFGTNSVAGEPRAVIGSVKSMIGHTMPAAGVAGLIKAALAIHHGVLPPTLHCEQPHELLSQTRFRTLVRQEAWHTAPGTPRVAAVNAFGFGGINAHIVLSSPSAPAAVPSRQRTTVKTPVALIAAASQEEMLRRLRAREWGRAGQSGRFRLAIVEPDDARCALAERVVSAGTAWHGKSQIYFSCEPLLSKGKLAFLFPGVDSAFEPQVADVAAHFGLAAPTHARKLDPSKRLMQVAFGLTEASLMLFDAISALRIQPQVMAGHSIGEWCAMAACGMLSRQFVEETMVRVQDEVLPDVDLLFVVASCDEAQARQALEGFNEVALSHDNCPHQVIFCGRKAHIESALERLRAQNILAQILPFASGFHSPLFEPFIAPYRESFDHSVLQEPVVPLWSATTCQQFPAELAAKRELAIEHLLRPVLFRQMIENLYADGCRVFIQVGTGSLIGFVQDTLAGQAHLAISANVPKRSGMQQLVHMCAALWSEGANFDTALLDANIAAAPARAVASKTKHRLVLGVPLIKINSPVALTGATLRTSVTVEEPALAFDSGDPLEATFSAVLRDIHRAGDDVLGMWRQRQAAASGGSRRTAPQSRLVAPTGHDGSPAPFDVRLTRRLDVNSTIPLVRDHSFIREREDWPVLADRRPLVPLTMEIELLRAALEAQVPGQRVIAFDNIEAFRWLLVAEPVDITLRLSMSQYPLVAVEIEGFLRGLATLGPNFPAAPARSARALTNSRAAPVTAHEMYRDNWMFHGDAYRGITRLGPLGDDGIDGEITVPAGPGALLDNMGQFAGYWVMATQSTAPLAMPIGVQHVRYYRAQPEPNETFVCETRIQELDEQGCRSDLQLVDRDGVVAVEMLGWRTRRYAMSPDFHDRMRIIETHTLSDTLGDAVATTGEEAEKNSSRFAACGPIAVFNDVYDTAIMRDYLAVRVLSQPELRAYEALPPRRKREWLNGRIAAKDAVRSYLWRKNGHQPIFPKELLIDNAQQGQPLVNAHITQCFTGPLHLSLSHKDSVAVAIASAHPVGIDIEAITAHSDAVFELTLSAAERALLPQQEIDTWFTRCWAAKEVVGKIRGTGLQGAPRALRLEAIRDHCLCVEGVWVDTVKYHNYIIAWGMKA